MAFPSGQGWAFFLTIPYCMHLVISYHVSLFLVVCHSSRTFLPKVLKRKAQNKLSPSSYRQTISSLTSDPWPIIPVLAGCKWVVLEPYACSTSMCVHGLSTVHAFAMTWGLFCMFYYSFLTSCGMDECLGFHSLCLNSFLGWVLLGYGPFLLQSIP